MRRRLRSAFTTFFTNDGQDNTTALHRAAINDQNEMVSFLLERQADVSIMNQVRIFNDIPLSVL
jgi:ankyrin repeat protein